MAEQVVIVCDVCGDPASAVVSLTVHSDSARAGQTYAKDLCARHLSDLLSSARRPRRGRRRGTLAAAGVQAAAPTRRRRAKAAPAGSAPATPGRRGRPRKTAPPADAEAVGE